MFSTLACNSLNCSDLNLERRTEMAEPIILDGGAQMITIKLPTSTQKDATEGGKFSVSPEPKDAPFERIVVWDHETGEVVFNLPLDDKTRWKIEIK
jgi:hypothetical protein